MKNVMSFIKTCFLFLIFIAVSLTVFSTSLFLNDSYFVNNDTISNDITQIALGELYPLMFDVYDVTFSFQNGDSFVFDENITEKFFDIYLSTTPDGTLIFNGNKIESISIKGEKCDISDLEIWIGWEGEKELKNVINSFSLKFGIKIKTLYVPNSYSKLISYIRSNKILPDIVMVESDDISTLMESKAIQNLDYIFNSSEENGSFFDKLKESFILGDKTWAYPFYADTHLILYNRKLIDFKNNTDSYKTLTLNDLKNMDEYVLAKEIIPISWNAYSGYFFLPFMMGFGKENFIEKDGTVRVNDVSSLKAIEYILTLEKESILDISERDAMTALFLEEKTSAIIGGSYMIPYLKSLGIDLGILTLPYNEADNCYIPPLLDIKGFAITRKSKNPVLSRRLIQYITNQKNQEEFCGELFKIPCRSEALDKIYANNGDGEDYSEKLRISVENGIAIPADKAYSVYKSTMWNILRFAISGQMKPQEALDTAQNIIDNNLKSR